MRKLILLSVILVPLILGIRLSNDAKPKRGLNRTVLMTFLFLVSWAIVGSQLFFVFSGN